MDISWDDARVFLAVAESGSFSGAARALRMGQPTVSRRIAEFEQALGVVLFNRGRRGAALTTDGERLLTSARQMARWAVEFERALAGGEDGAQGPVRLTAPPGIAFEFLVPFCAGLRARHPGIRLDLLATVDYLDLTLGQADLAIRGKPASEPGVETLYQLEVPVGVFASPAYRARLPEGPLEVGDLDWICWAGAKARLMPRPQLEALIPGFEPAFAADDYLIQVRACQAGLGAMFRGRIRHPLMADMGLVELPVALPPVTDHIYLVGARSMQHVPRVRAVIEALIDALDDTVRLRPRGMNGG